MALGIRPLDSAREAADESDVVPAEAVGEPLVAA
jgi:hypothetical protein